MSSKQLDAALDQIGTNGHSPAPTSWPAAMRREAFVGLPGEFVMMVEPHTEADRHGLLLQLLAAAGNAIGRNPGVMADGAFHSTVIWPVLIGETAKARKGTSWSRVRMVMELADPDWAAARIAGGLSTGEGIVWHVRDEIRGRRKAKKTEIPDDDGMVEDVIDVGEPDKRLCVVETEFAQPFRVMQREGNTLSIALKRLWDFGEAGALTKRDHTRTSGAHVTVIGHGTVDELRAVISEVDVASGLINRHLFCCVRRSQLLPDGGWIHDDVLGEFAGRLAAAIAAARSFKQALERTPETTARWGEVYGRLTADRPGMIGRATSRAEAQVLRLSLIYAVLAGEVRVHLEHLEAALAVWDYCEASAMYLFGDSTGDELADVILDALRQHKRGMARSEIRELVGGKASKARIEVALDLLARHGLAERDVITTGGRPAERWKVTTTEEDR